MTIAWLDLTCGVSGDMMLGALAAAGVPVDVMRQAVGALDLPVSLRATPVQRGGLTGVKVDVVTAASPPVERRWQDVRRLLSEAALPAAVRSRALDIFGRLADAEATVHGVDVADVHFHEVGALDALADVVGTAAGLEHLGAERIVASPVALGGGTARTEHGTLPVPGPAVLEILRSAGAPAYGGPVEMELCTPTGAAIVASTADDYGEMPLMTVTAVGIGAGTRQLPDRPNAVRLVVGEPVADDVAYPTAAAYPSGRAQLIMLEANVDDLDPRLWPGVLSALLAAGAADAWLTPILMKKGRPAHVLSALAAPAAEAGVREMIYRETTTLGIRRQWVSREALERELLTVRVDGEAIRVKVGRSPAGELVNAMPEWADVLAAAQRLDRPAKQVLAAAQGAAAALLARN